MDGQVVGLLRCARNDPEARRRGKPAGWAKRSSRQATEQHRQRCDDTRNDTI